MLCFGVRLVLRILGGGGGCVCVFEGWVRRDYGGGFFLWFFLSVLDGWERGGGRATSRCPWLPYPSAPSPPPPPLP